MAKKKKTRKVTQPAHACKYPHIAVRLIGTCGNAYSVMGQVRRAMMNAGVDEDAIKQFVNEATDGDYNHLVRVCMAWVNIE